MSNNHMLTLHAGPIRVGIILVTLFNLLLSVAHAAERTFPAAAGLLNVKSFGAKGDGVTNDTAAWQAALNAMPERATLFVPKGTYLVNQTLRFPTKPRHLTLQGQSRDSTILRLMGRSPGFLDPAVPTPVLQTQAGNTAFGYRIFHLTIDVGPGNPGAVGLDYISNNSGIVQDVLIRSRDPQRLGARGLDMSRQYPGPALLSRVTIEGFDYGIVMRHGSYAMTAERLTLRHQRIRGIDKIHNYLFIRQLTSENTVEVIRNNQGTVLVVEATLSGGAPGAVALTNTGKGVLAVRSLNVSTGYKAAIANHNDPLVPVGSIAEYTSDDPHALFTPNAGTSLRLPVPETPDVPWESSTWVNVADFGARANDGVDDGPGVQAAIDAANATGRHTVYFPSGTNAQWHLGQTIHVYGTIKRVIGLQGVMNLSGSAQAQNAPLFRVEPGQPTVVLERMFLRRADRQSGFTAIDHAAANTLVLKHGHGGHYRNRVTGGKVFMEEWTNFLDLQGPQQVWIRHWNPETGSLELPVRAANNGATLWVLGMKTEGNGDHIETVNGGRTEVLGQRSGWGQGDQSRYTDFIVRNSEFSAMAFRPAWSRVVEEERGDEVRVWSIPTPPSRFGLYVGW
jgi:hypothetical protein